MGAPRAPSMTTRRTTTATPPSPTPSRRRESDWVDADGNAIHDHDRGLLYDLGTMNRRRALGSPRRRSGRSRRWPPAARARWDRRGRLGLVDHVERHGAGSAARAARHGTASATAAHRGARRDGGPFPADGSNGVDVARRLRHRALRHPVQVRLLDDDGRGRAADRSTSPCATPDRGGRDGAAVYPWHCDAQGQYSIVLAAAVEDENYLRGVQPTDASGTVSFTTVFPGCYTGRWPHIHFEVYRQRRRRDLVRADRQDLPDRAAPGGL